MTTRNFEGRVAVVTGAGVGLGRAYALELARRGCRVVVNDIGGSGAGVGSSRSPADAVVAEIAAAQGSAVASYDTVATRAGGRAIVDAALDTFGRLDIVISNAGFLRNARFEDMTDDEFDAIIDVHLKGAFYVGQPAFAVMKRQGYGRFLFTASSSGMCGHPWQVNYGSAKAGLFGLSNVIALEGKDHGVLSNAIMPIARTRLGDEIDWAWKNDASEVGAIVDELGVASSASRPWFGPEWVAPLAIRLVSEDSTVTQGIFSAVNGRYARVFVGAAEGWKTRDLPSAEDLAAHWGEICDVSRFDEPKSVYEEVLMVEKAFNRDEPVSV